MGNSSNALIGRWEPLLAKFTFVLDHKVQEVCFIKIFMEERPHIGIAGCWRRHTSGQRGSRRP